MLYQIKHVGIVLKIEQRSGHKIALLDKSLGRIDAIAFKPITSPGVILEYHLTQRSVGNYTIEDVCVLDMPLRLAHHDLLFLHHVLEICFYFIPVHSCAAGIFELLAYLYTDSAPAWSSLFKKIFVFKLLIVIGYYPEVKHLSEKTIRRLVLTPLEDIPYDVTFSKLESHLNDWLRQCIAQHPAIEYFNTIHFIM